MASVDPDVEVVAPQVRLIDISDLSNRLGYVDTANFCLLLVGQLGFFACLFDLFQEPSGGAAALLNFVELFGCAYFFWTAWKNRGVLGALRNKHTYVALALLASFLVLWEAYFTAVLVLTRDIGNVVSMAGRLLILCGCLCGFAALMRLRPASIPHLNVPLRDFLRHDFLDPDSPVQALPPRSSGKGVLYIVGGGLWLFGFHVIDQHLSVSETWSARSLLCFGYVWLLRGMQCFQPDFDVVMAQDRRAPILFLRSFGDDQKVKRTEGLDAVIDFSLESRLARHFFGYGPFIAVGAPAEAAAKYRTNPHLGAVRVQLADSDWQEAVTHWMDTSAVILCMAGWSEWVGWELKKVVELGHVEKLILILPEQQTSSKDAKSKAKAVDMSPAARLERVRQAFQGSRWEAALAQVSFTKEVRCVVFHPDATVTAMISRETNRDSYHLAALLGHSLQLGLVHEPSEALSVAQPERAASELETGVLFRRVIAAVADALLIVALLALFVFVVAVLLALRHISADSINGFLEHYGGRYPWVARGVILLSLGLAGFLYYWVLEGLCGATVGKLIAGVRVKTIAGEQCNARAAAIRNGLRFFDGAGFYLPGFVLATLSPLRQRLGDQFAGTVVVRARQSARVQPD